MKYSDLGFTVEDIIEGNPVTLPEGFRLKEPMDDQTIYEECWLVFNDRNRFRHVDLEIDTKNDLEALRLQYMVGLGLAYALKDMISSNSDFHKLDIKERKKFYDRANNAIHWITENMDPVMAISTGKMMIAFHKLPFNTKHMPAFDEFAKKYRTYIIDAADHVSPEFKAAQQERIKLETYEATKAETMAKVTVREANEDPVTGVRTTEI